MLRPTKGKFSCSSHHCRAEYSDAGGDSLPLRLRGRIAEAAADRPIAGAIPNKTGISGVASCAVTYDKPHLMKTTTQACSRNLRLWRSSGVNMRHGILIATLTAALHASGADAIPLTPRPHMDEATLKLYNRIRMADGLLLGLGELFAPPVPRQLWEPLYDNSMQRWRQLYGETLPACYEFEIGEANHPKAIREWDEAKRYADLGGVVWLQGISGTFGSNP